MYSIVYRFSHLAMNVVGNCVIDASIHIVSLSEVENNKGEFFFYYYFLKAYPWFGELGYY